MLDSALILLSVTTQSCLGFSNGSCIHDKNSLEKKHLKWGGGGEGFARFSNQVGF